MRSIKLRPAFAAAVTLLALAPVTAGAAGGHKHAGLARCHVSLFAEPHVVTSGEQAEVFGQLACPGGTNTAGLPVTLYAHTLGSGFKVVGTLSAGAGGFYSLKLPSLTTDTVFYVRGLGARSANRRVHVAPIVTFAGAAPGPGLAPLPGRTALLTGGRNSVTFIGSVSPSDAGAEVILQRESQSSFEEWVPIQRGTVSTASTFAIKHAFLVPGDANLRVIVRRHGNFTFRGVSEPISYTISQPQNPNLTLETSPNPVASGQPVTIKGVVKNGAHQKVVLLSRTKGLPLTKADETVADANGAYTFTEKPAHSTIYRATAAGLSSSSQFEGVKYVVTATASATKVQSGQPVAFTGTVNPIQAGHPVYIERQSAIGGGFHVVEVTTVSGAGTYSIAHAVFGSGTAVLRIHIPGGPENQGASSQTFPIEVTPAPPGALHPAAPGRLPSEGKL
ncbi:MAG TPA: hypothetical protein VGN08_01155 [Solirubrobacteraceae bacterium]|jgi:hypothetical protein